MPEKPGGGNKNELYSKKTGKYIFNFKDNPYKISDLIIDNNKTGELPSEFFTWMQGQNDSKILDVCVAQPFIIKNVLEDSNYAKSINQLFGVETEKIFPNKIKELDMQGVDYIVTTKSGKRFFIDQKCSFINTNDPLFYDFTTGKTVEENKFIDGFFCNDNKINQIITKTCLTLKNNENNDTIVKKIKNAKTYEEIRELQNSIIGANTDIFKVNPLKSIIGYTYLGLSKDKVEDIENVNKSIRQSTLLYKSLIQNFAGEIFPNPMEWKNSNYYGRIFSYIATNKDNIYANVILKNNRKANFFVRYNVNTKETTVSLKFHKSLLDDNQEIQKIKKSFTTKTGGEKNEKGKVQSNS